MLPLALLFVVSAAAPDVRVHRTRVVVMDIDTTGNVDAGVAKSLGLVLPTAVRKSADASAQVLSLSDARALLGLQQTRSRLGCSSDSDCLAELGGALGADELIVGRLAQVGSTYLLELRRIDTHHARVLGSAVAKTDGRPDELVAMTESLVPQLYGASVPAPTTDKAAAAPVGGLMASTAASAPQPSRAIPVTLLVAGSVLVSDGVGCIVYSGGVHSSVDAQQPGQPNEDAPTVTRSQYQQAGTLYPIGWGAAIVGAGLAGFGIYGLVHHDSTQVMVAPTQGGAVVAARGSF